jgi:hypothetical protein
MNRLWRTISCLALLTLLSACTKTGEDEQGSPTTGGGSGPKVSGAFATNCGTVVNGKLKNPASAGDGFRSPIKVMGANLLSITLPTGPLMVKLHGLSAPSSSSKASAAQSTLEGLAALEDGIFIPADSDCTARLGNGSQGAFGQVFTASGRSYSELLVEQGLAQVSSDACGGELLTPCYKALQENSDKKVAGEIGRLLWKPISDSTGKLAVHTGPFGVTVKVSGEEGKAQGGGNGYGDLARFSKPGCGYGANVQVQVFNSQGAAYTFNGSTTITIPNGCQRYCIEGKTLAPCAKR